MQFIVDGLLLGLTLSILLGPLLLALTQTGIQRGFRAGLSVAIGIWISDFSVIFLSWYFIHQVGLWIKNPQFYSYLGFGGTLILISMGIYSLTKKSSLTLIKKTSTSKSIFKNIAKGFSVNTFNPFTFVFWFGLMSTYLLTKKVSNQDVFILCTTILLTIMTTDTLKVWLAKSISQKLNDTVIDKINKVAGILFVIFGIVLFFRTLYWEGL